MNQVKADTMTQILECHERALRLYALGCPILASIAEELAALHEAELFGDVVTPANDAAVANLDEP